MGHPIVCFPRTRARAILFVIMLSAVCGHPASGQSWQALDGPTGGAVMNLHQAGSWLLAATEGGVYRKHDTSTVWTRSNAGLDVHFIYAFTGTNPLLAATSRGVFVSYDTARTWQRPPEPLDTLYVTALLTHSSGVVFAGTSERVLRSHDGGLHWTDANLARAWTQALHETPGGDILASFYYEGVWRTANVGGSWTRIFNVSTTVEEIAADSSGVLYVATWYRGIYRSSNNGSTWVQSNSGLHPGVHAFAVFPASANRVLAGTDSLIYESRDHGLTWTPVTSPGCGYSTISRGRSGVLHAATNCDGVYTSSDGGNTWLRNDSGFTAETLTALLTLPSGMLVASTQSYGVYLSSDNGSHWQHQSLGLPWFELVRALSCDSTGRLYAATGTGLYRSLDGGLTWVRKDAGITNKAIITVVATHGSVVLAVNDSGVYRSPDAGETWTKASTVLTSFMNAHSLGRHPATGALFAATNDHIYRSLDDGFTWMAKDSGLTGFYYMCISFGKDGSVWAGSATTPFRSSNGGESWHAAGDSAGPININTLVADRRSGIVYCGTDSGRVYWTGDNGATWNLLPIPDAHGFVRTMARDSAGFVLAGVTGYGLYRSTAIVPATVESFWATVDNADVTLRWRVLDERNVTAYRIERLAVKAGSADWRTIDTRAARGSGIYETREVAAPHGRLRYRLRVIDSDGTEEIAAYTEAHLGSVISGLRITGVSPLPARDAASVAWTLAEAGPVRLTVWTALGVPVYTRQIDAPQAGSYSTRLDLRGLAPGMYLLRLESASSSSSTSFLLTN
ncbi:MAG: hypothetical protein HY962_17655 [Ignavibacteriae bacterium]|nr:hypothetical protein [Ignavibacteriota bacterium]